MKSLFQKVNILCLCAVLLFPFTAGLQKTAAGSQDYIIVYKDHTNKRNTTKRHKFNPRHTFNIIPAVSATLEPNQVQQFRDDPEVSFVEPDYNIYAMGASETQTSAAIEALTSTQVIPYGVTMVKAPAAWLKTKGAGVRVAVLDTGISMYHPDRGNVVGSASFVTDEVVEDFDGHGTHTAGTIAAADNQIGVVGVAPDADLLIGKILDNEGSGQTSWLISGIEWAVANNAKVISMSLGSSDYSAALETACNNAYAAGILLVAAAGNDNTSTAFYPAGFSSVLSVSAVDQNKAKASFSNYGSDIELAAPGVSVYSSIPVDSYTATANAIWSSASHQANIITGTAAGAVSGLVCNCGLATGSGSSNSCPDNVTGNIAHIRRGTTTFAEKVAYARSKGAVGVIISNNAAGNFNGTLNDGSPLVVVSISQSDGDTLQSLAASGVSATVSVSDALYDYYNGTSMACPHVSGVAALVYAADGYNISAVQVRNILLNSAEDIGSAGWDQYFGYGLVNADAALNLVVPRTCDSVQTLGYGLAGDINHDCFVNWNDLQTIIADWQYQFCGSSNDWCSGGDVDHTGTVNFADYSRLALDWLNCNDPQACN